MPITIVQSSFGNSDSNSDPAAYAANAPLISFQAGEFAVVMMVFRDDVPAGNITVSNTNGVLTWNLIQDANVGGASRVLAYWARVDTTASRRVTASWDSGNNLTWAQYYVRMTGVDAGATPIGSSSKGSNVASATYNITPAGSGSAAFMLAADANSTGTQTISAGSGCGIVMQATGNTHFCSAVISPTTNPRTDASAFTLAETHTGTGVSWVGFEVKAAASASPIKRLSMLGIG